MYFCQKKHAVMIFLAKTLRGEGRKGYFWGAVGTHGACVRHPHSKVSHRKHRLTQKFYSHAEGAEVSRMDFLLSNFSFLLSAPRLTLLSFLPKTLFMCPLLHLIRIFNAALRKSPKTCPYICTV